ncbi:MAG: permease, partial [Pseudomonadota bacterium]
MTALALRLSKSARRIDTAYLAILLILAAIAILDFSQLPVSLVFTAEAVLHILPFFVASILAAAYGAATGADNLIARAFEGRAVQATIIAALAGAISPFCSCGVIPLIAALLAMGVPLAPVMAFWLASPLMDPT